MCSDSFSWAAEELNSVAISHVLERPRHSHVADMTWVTEDSSGASMGYLAWKHLQVSVYTTIPLKMPTYINLDTTLYTQLTVLIRPALPVVGNKDLAKSQISTYRKENIGVLIFKWFILFQNIFQYYFPILLWLKIVFQSILKMT